MKHSKPYVLWLESGNKSDNDELKSKLSDMFSKDEGEIGDKVIQSQALQTHCKKNGRNKNAYRSRNQPNISQAFKKVAKTFFPFFAEKVLEEHIRFRIPN